VRRSFPNANSFHPGIDPAEALLAWNELDAPPE
jgi:hypothetical protein